MRASTSTTSTPARRPRASVYQLFGRNVLFYGVLIIVLALLRGIFLFFMRQTLIVMSRRIENDQKNQIYQHYQSLPLSFYRRHSTGDLMSRISEDVSRVRMYLGPAIMYFLQLVLLFLLIVPLMLMVNVKLTLYTLLPLPVLSVSIFYVNNLIERKSDEIQRALSGMTTFVQEAFSGIRVLKSFVREAGLARAILRGQQRVQGKVAEPELRELAVFPAHPVSHGPEHAHHRVGGRAGGYSRHHHHGHHCRVPDLREPAHLAGHGPGLDVLAGAAGRGLAGPHQRVSGPENRHRLAPERAARAGRRHRVRKRVLHLPRYRHSGPEKRELPREAGPDAGRYRQHRLGQKHRGRPALPPLRRVGGRINIDGTDVRDYSLRALRGQIGYVPQDVFLFSDTIRNNINFGLDAARRGPDAASRPRCRRVREHPAPSPKASTPKWASGASRSRAARSSA